MKPGMLKRLERFNKALEILEKLKTKRKEVFVNDLWLTSVAERNIQIAVEFAIDLSNSLLSKLGAPIPESYKDSIKKLKEFEVIDETMEKKMKKIVGLRNIIVHLYAYFISA